MGPDQIGGYVDTVVDLAHDVALRLDADPAIEVAATPQLSTVVFRYRPDGVSEDEADRLTPLIRTALYESGTAMVAATKVSGRCWLKLTLLNPMATTEQVLGICARIVSFGNQLALEEAVA
ncbi:hypothetical protein NSZ01_09670 [Nocardioides szechwanensis]|nr:hypothetical protein NSZ01_09670 [Nocardioides szechwanensis]